MNLFQFCLAFLSVSISGSLVAQFNFTEGPIVDLEITQPYELMDIYCTPDTAKNITINWELIEIESSIPAEWGFTICDIICYPFFPSIGSGVSYTTTDWDTAMYNLKLGVSHNNVNGSGSLTYYLFDQNDPTYGDTLVFNLNFQSAGINKSPEFPKDLTISNPSNELVLDPNNTPRTVQIRTTMGQLVFENRLVEKTIIGDLPAGIYFLIVDNNWIKRIAINMNQNK